MASKPKKTVGTVAAKVKRIAVRKRTSVGQSLRSRPLNKHARRSYKKYRGQGRP